MMKGIVSIESVEDHLAVVLENEFGLVFHADGMTIIGNNGQEVELGWPAVDKVANLARGTKVIYANGQVPVLREATVGD